MRVNKLEKVISFIGLDYKKERLKMLLLNLVGLIASAVIYVLSKNAIYGIGLFGVTVASDYIFISSYFKKKQIILHQRNDEFITIINYFEVFINNQNNVYQAFNKLINYSSPWMSERIQEFLLAIDNDKSLQPFLDFANNFQMEATKNVMIAIYQMIDQGENSNQLMEFTFLFHEMSKSRHEEMKKKKEKSLSSMTVLPLIGASGIAITITLSIISIVGDMMNVI